MLATESKNKALFVKNVILYLRSQTIHQYVAHIITSSFAILLLCVVQKSDKAVMKSTAYNYSHISLSVTSHKVTIHHKGNQCEWYNLALEAVCNYTCIVNTKNPTPDMLG